MLQHQAISEFSINEFFLVVYIIPSDFDTSNIIKPTEVKRIIKVPDINHVILKLSDVDNRIIKPTKRLP